MDGGTVVGADGATVVEVVGATVVGSRRSLATIGGAWWVCQTMNPAKTAETTEIPISVKGERSRSILSIRTQLRSWQAFFSYVCVLVDSPVHTVCKGSHAIASKSTMVFQPCHRRRWERLCQSFLPDRVRWVTEGALWVSECGDLFN